MKNIYINKDMRQYKVTSPKFSKIGYVRKYEAVLWTMEKLRKTNFCYKMINFSLKTHPCPQEQAMIEHDLCKEAVLLQED